MPQPPNPIYTLPTVEVHNNLKGRVALQKSPLALGFALPQPSNKTLKQESLKHQFLQGEASDKVLKVQENLRSWRARMRFKKAIIATVRGREGARDPSCCRPPCFIGGFSD